MSMLSILKFCVSPPNSCPHCDGLGIVSTLETMLCVKCSGSGNQLGRHCDVCWGTGSDKREFEVVCPTCSGQATLRRAA